MATMGRYCKAYPIQRLRAFSEWSEKTENTRAEKHEADGKEVTAPRPLTDDDFLYLQENFVVTDGIFLDENIIFDHLTPEWIDYCKTDLKFEVPVCDTAEAKATVQAAQTT